MADNQFLTNGENVLLVIAAVVQAIDIIERRWRERKIQRKTSNIQEITEIVVIMDDGSHHQFKRWVSNPESLKAYIEAFSNPASKIKPLQVVFYQREGHPLTINVTEGGKDNQQLNIILGYLGADPPKT